MQLTLSLALARINCLLLVVALLFILYCFCRHVNVNSYKTPKVSSQSLNKNYAKSSSRQFAARNQRDASAHITKRVNNKCNVALLLPLFLLLLVYVCNTSKLTAWPVQVQPMPSRVT